MDETTKPGPMPDLGGEMVRRGFVHLSADVFRDLAGLSDRAAFADFARSWNDLGPDRYMADGGRYRRRRYAAFDIEGSTIARRPHQPHFQSRDYNPLNGDVQRWFDPVCDAVADHPVTGGLLRFCTAFFDGLAPASASEGWLVEYHQFRIEAREGEQGLPTPEGMHRDGVDWVLVMLVARENVAAGATNVIDDRGHRDSFTLTMPGEAILLDDRRIRHGVTPIHPVDPARPACRDVLVITWRAASAI